MRRRKSSDPPRIKNWGPRRRFGNFGDSEIARAWSRRGKHGPAKQEPSDPDFTSAHLQRWRKSRIASAGHITQTQLAYIFNVSQGSISRWERGSMPFDIIERLAAVDNELRKDFDLDGYLAGYIHGLDKWNIPYSLERTPLEKPRFAALREQARKSGELGEEETKSDPANPIKFDPFIK